MDRAFTTDMLYFIIGALVVLIAAVIYGKRTKKLPTVVFRAIYGVFGIFVLNYAFSPFGVKVGVNFITCGAAVFLGVPGVVALYLAQMLI